MYCRRGGKAETWRGDMMHDLAIRNALILDGDGGPGFRGDVAVEGDRIVAVGADVGAARENIDADGLAVMPGIIDSHTHYDAQVTWDSGLVPSPELGVTTAIFGNCGFAIAPCRPGDRELTMRNLTHVEGMSLDVLREGIRWDFQTFPEYLDQIEKQGTVPNVAAFVGHSAVRTWVMGADAHKRAATADEVARMRAVVLEAMQAGAAGFATSTAPQHNGEAGIPMPSRLAEEEELRALTGALGDVGRGVFMLTKGGQTTVPFLEELAAANGRPVMIAALLHNSTNPNVVFDDLAMIGEAQERGRKLYGQVSCCPLTNDFTLLSAYPFEGLSAWLPAMQAEGEALKAVYADAEFRARVKQELTVPAPVRLFNGEWDKLDIIEVADPANRACEGRTVADLAREAGKHPLDWMLDFSLSEDLKTIFSAVLLNSDEEAVGRLLNDSNASIALSDAGAHLTFFCDAGFGLHLMGHWVRELNKMSLEKAVWQLTARPADIYGVRERGRLKPGYHADLLLFDPATVGRTGRERVFDLPGGAPRLTTHAVGVHGVWVNGVKVADGDGRIVDSGLPGRLLRDFAA